MTETPEHDHDDDWTPPEGWVDPRDNPDLPWITHPTDDDLVDEPVPPQERLDEEPEHVEVLDRGQAWNLPRELRAAIDDDDELLSLQEPLARGRIAPGVGGISLTDYSRTPQQRGFGAPCKQQMAVIQLTEARISVHVAIAELTGLIMRANEAQGYRYRKGDTGCYNCRPIAGTSSYSWHSWAIAIDANWSTNPQRSPRVTDRPRWELDRWNRYGYAWGGDYTGGTRPDTMHTEAMFTTAHIPALLVLARRELLPIINHTAPTPKPPAPAPARPPRLAWPWPSVGASSHRIGNVNDPRSYIHGGSPRYDSAAIRALVRNVQQWLIYRGCTPVPAQQWASSGWADSLFEGASIAAMNLWHSRFYPGQQAPGECWADDYKRLTA